MSKVLLIMSLIVWVAGFEICYPFKLSEMKTQSKEKIMKRMDISTKKNSNTYVMVDDDLFDYLNQWKWHKNYDGYAVRRESKRVEGKRKCIFMHRVIVGTPIGKVTDHINHNRLDNQGNNLRICTVSQNCMHKTKSARKGSRYKGVYWRKSRKHWMVYITAKGRNLYMGSSKSEVVAAEIYNKSAKLYFGEFAYLNKTGLENNIKKESQSGR